MLGASFPGRPADSSEFLRRLRSATDCGVWSDLTSTADRAPYAVPIGIWVGVKRSEEGTA